MGNQKNEAVKPFRLQRPDAPTLLPSQRFISQVASAIAILVGCLVLIGWTLDVGIFKRILPGLVAMNPTTAVAFILAGLSLLLRTQSMASSSRRIAQGLAFAVALIGLLKLVEILFGLDVGIDQLLFRQELESEAAVTGLPNRMAPNTALNFFLLGCALLLLDRQTHRGRWPAQYLVLVAAATSLLAVIGYAYGVKSFYGISSYIPMAMHTALTFIVLLTGLLCARPDRGLIDLLTRNSAGGVTVRRLLPAAILIPTVLGWLRLEGQREGLYDTELGAALLVLASIAIFIALVGWNAHLLDRADAERKRAEEGQARLAAIVESSDDAIISKTLDGIITSWNRGAQKIYGYSPEEVVGKPINILAPPDRFGEISAILERIKQGKVVDHTETVRVTKDARRIDVSITVSPIKDSAGNIAGASAIARDITERKRADKELQEAREAADAANRAKSEFLSRMSHELRTPLNAILGFAQLLELEDLRPAERESVNQILKAGRHLLGLINEVLDIARIEAGRMDLSMEPIDVREVLRETLDLVRPLAAHRNIRLHSDVAETFEQHVLADRQRLKQVLLNLLYNAIKYNREEGAVTVSCEEVPRRRVRFGVSDTGPGIAPESVERLFVPFDRLEAEQTEVEGTGLGLALSKKLVELMGGEIGVESTVGHGSTFWVELDLAEPQIESHERMYDEGPQTQVTVSERAGVVLYIEDNPSNLKLVQRILDQQRPGVELIPAMQGQLGLDLASEHRPDLILLDLHLPGIRGDEVLRRLRKEQATRRIPVVVVSADATPGQTERLLAAGAQTYLTKPIDVKEFLTVLDRTLERGEP